MLDVVGHLRLLVHQQVIVQFLVMRGYTGVASGRCYLLMRYFGIVVLGRHRADLPRVIA